MGQYALVSDELLGIFGHIIMSVLTVHSHCPIPIILLYIPVEPIDSEEK